ncbi:hypothetical protein PHYSODRAFT_252765 [Phytophthora sojae]|uniref:RXLR phytopathogen effector protein WY-domain domain-containing protein n=1 Tax=Phytophthora sojae (strain P6497) TaxID=1094619 RepID=G5A7M5_PHYSP|nr:hypothetical protein PHYSODRAFT_252765 [Phytophthora sojae]EGZ07901.1 hypothetical protein PHYSODRAFT_252765 [Phytophthora sojae]|eukprot:XP_009536073.1 hypothetical protein PHYSODRAFT_252765 [Phytophthora sojae]
MVAKFREVLHTKWLREKKSAGDVFDYVLKEAHKYALKARDLKTWVSYVTKLDKEEPYKTMLSVLKGRFGGEQLVRMIGDAEKASDTTVTLTKLKHELWLSEKKTAADEFGLLGLNRLNAKSADEMMFSVLKDIYPKKELVAMLAAAKQVEEAKEFATRMEKQLVLSLGK